MLCYTPNIDDVLPHLSKAKVFSMLDRKNVFWQVKRDDESNYFLDPIW